MYGNIEKAAATANSAAGARMALGNEETRSNPKAPSPPGEIAIQAQNLGKNLSRLTECIYQLFDRLEPVLDSESVGNAPSDPTPSCTKMGGYLAVQNSRIEYAIGALETLLSRVEL